VSIPGPDSNLTVAVTGPTGTFGFGLLPLLQADERISKVVGIARRPFDATQHGWTKMTFRQGDVRDPAALEAAFEGADVVVHLAFMITGAASRETIRQINVEGTLNAFRAAAAAGARRLLGPDFVGAKDVLPSALALAPLLRRLGGLRRRLRLPVIALPVPIQFIHQDDVGQAFLPCIVGAGPHGVYNITGDGVLSGAQVIRELGFAPIPAPERLGRAAARPRAALRPFRSPRRSPNGRKPSVTRRSWTPAKPSRNSVGSRSTAASRRCATR
jgi:nucleoside-diphosphate-sugar epimerase